MIASLRKEYFFPNMKFEVVGYLERCLECQQVKTFTPSTYSQMEMEVITMDFITCFPKTKKQNDSIMVVVNKFSKETHFIQAKSTYKHINIANIFMKVIFLLHGIPKVIISNRDAKFTSNF